MLKNTSILLASSLVLLTGCDKIGLKEVPVKAEAGLWEITLTARLPGTNDIVTKVEQFCMTAEEVQNSINEHLFLPNQNGCENDITGYKTINTNLSMQRLNCEDAIIGNYQIDLTLGQGDNAYDKFATIEKAGIVELFGRQLRDLGMVKTPEGNKIELVELGVYKETCDIKAKERNVRKGAKGSGSGKMKTKLSDFLKD